jgi:serine/threonine protein kinase
MSLGAGTRLGPYEISSPIGSGGMGEVYRARDTRLGRDVAIKVLPAAMAGDSDRQVRFEREARVVALVEPPVHRTLVRGLIVASCAVTAAVSSIHREPQIASGVAPVHGSAHHDTIPR